MSDTYLIYEQSGTVAQVTFNRSDVLNAFKISMFKELLEIIARVSDDDSVRVLLLTGNGRAFSAGIDLDEQSHLFEDDIRLKPAQENLALMQDVSRQMLKLSKPIIAAINGPAIGVGAELSIASDVRIASEDAYFMFAEVKRGIFETNGVMYFLPRLVGYGRALEWMLTGDRISAQDALKAGLVTHLKSGDDLLPFALAMAQRMAANAPIPMCLVKQVVQRSYDLDLESVMQLETAGTLDCIISDDFKEGVRAFLEKRSPKYQGR
jgi:enoyl-CoA hydratase/carnithine racemase